ncbi:MAG TPA: hypothetical protein DC054_20205 [Blastocatellia bacterium]|nr:hypothetical protein [Blastocatellia bacterium]
MRDYTVEQTSLNFKWNYKRMMSFVPTPGTPSFAAICKGLTSYELDASRITVDAPTTRFGDVMLGIALLGNRAALRFTPSFLELYVTSLYDGDEERLLGIVNAALTALEEADSDSAQGEAHVRLACHLKLAPLENFALLRDHLKISDTITDLIPEAAVYQIEVPKESRIKELRVVIARSVAYEDALFLDVNIVYPGPLETAVLARQVEADFNLVVEKIGLREKVKVQ